MQFTIPDRPLADCEIGNIIRRLHEQHSVNVVFVDRIANRTELDRAQELRSRLSGKLNCNVSYKFIGPTRWEFSFA